MFNGRADNMLCCLVTLHFLDSETVLKQVKITQHAAGAHAAFCGAYIASLVSPENRKLRPEKPRFRFGSVLPKKTRFSVRFGKLSQHQNRR